MSPSPTLRSYTPADLESLAFLQKGRAPSPAEVEGLARDFGQPNLAPERDCVLAFEDEQLVGYAYLTHEPALRRGVLDLVAGGEHWGGGVGDALLGETMARARSAGLSVVHVDVQEADEERRRTYSERGWRHVRTHLHLTRASAVRANAPVPEGMSVRQAERRDAQAITDLQNAAFTGSWGYAPNNVAEIEYRVFDQPMLRPDPVALLEEAGQVVGYCWCHREAEPGPGVVGMVGVPPGRQGQGLGQAITGAGIDGLLDLGASPIEITVDSENPPAIRVYEGLGFVLAWRSFWYELSL